jgi:hypothetical protein
MIGPAFAGAERRASITGGRIEALYPTALPNVRPYAWTKKNNGNESHRAPAKIRRAGDCRAAPGEREISNPAGQAVRTEKAGACVARVVCSRIFSGRRRE